MIKNEKSLQGVKNALCQSGTVKNDIDGDGIDELVKGLALADSRASVKIMVKDYADGWYELEVSNCTNVGALIEALRGRKSNA